MSITPHRTDRRCAHPGCITVLCVYNEGPTCYLHTKAANLTRLKMEQVAYEKLMKQLGHGERIAA